MIRYDICLTKKNLTKARPLYDALSSFFIIQSFLLDSFERMCHIFEFKSGHPAFGCHFRIPYNNNFLYTRYYK